MNNHFNDFGHVLKELRLKNNMTKTQLANGICSSSYITRIENGERVPTSVIMRQLCNKLGINSEILLRLIESPISLQQKEIIEQIFHHIGRSDYKKFYDLVHKSESLFKNASFIDKQTFDGFKVWIDALINNNYSDGIYKLKEVAKRTYKKGGTPTDIEFVFLFTSGYFMIKNKQYKEAYEYLSSLEKHIENIQFIHCKTMIPGFYSCLIEASLEVGIKNDYIEKFMYTIKYCIDNNLQCYLPEIYYLIAKYHEKNENYEATKMWKLKAKYLMEITSYPTDNENFKEYIGSGNYDINELIDIIRSKIQYL